MKATQENVIAKLVKGGFNAKSAERMTKKYWEIAAAHCSFQMTTKNMADAISWFYAVQ